LFYPDLLCSRQIALAVLEFSISDLFGVRVCVDTNNAFVDVNDEMIFSATTVQLQQVQLPQETVSLLWLLSQKRLQRLSYALQSKNA
jgi:hypothetical protein